MKVTVIKVENVKRNNTLNFVKGLNEYPFIYCEIEGHSGIFTDCEIYKKLLDSIPKAIHHYDIRHDVHGYSVPITLENNVAANRLGTFLTLDEIDFDGAESIDINDYYFNKSFNIKYNDWVMSNQQYILSHKLDNKNDNTDETIKVNIYNPDESFIAMIKPTYDSDESGSIIISDFNLIRINPDNKFKQIYANIWAKGWTTLSDPNSTQECGEIFFGKCTKEEISIIEKAAEKTELVVGIETLLNKKYNGHGEEELEAYEVTVSVDDEIHFDVPLNDIANYMKKFSEELGFNEYPYPSNKKRDLYTLRFKDGYCHSYIKSNID